MDTKPWWQSKTVWMNMAIATVGALAETVPAVRDYLPQGWYGIYMVAVALVNVWLRTISTATLTK